MAVFADFLLDAETPPEWSASGGNASCSFTAPDYPTRLRAKATAPAAIVLVSIGVNTVNLNKTALLTGVDIESGADPLSFTITGGSAQDGHLLSEHLTMENAVDPISVSQEGFSNSAVTPIG